MTMLQTFASFFFENYDQFAMNPRRRPFMGDIGVTLSQSVPTALSNVDDIFTSTDSSVAVFKASSS